MLLALFRSWLRRGRAADAPAEARERREALLAAAEAAWREAGRTEGPFRQEALYDLATTRMVQAVGDALWRYAVGAHGVSAAEAEELAQDAFIVFRRLLPGFGGQSTLKTLLYGIMENVARAHRAKEARRQGLLEARRDEVGGGLSGRERGEQEEVEARDEARRAAVARALARMPAREAFVVRARLGDGLEYQEILPRFQAAHGGRVTTAGGLRTLFFKARRRLVGLLEEGADER